MLNQVISKLTTLSNFCSRVVMIMASADILLSCSTLAVLLPLLASRSFHFDKLLKIRKIWPGIVNKLESALFLPHRVEVLPVYPFMQPSDHDILFAVIVVLLWQSWVSQFPSGELAIYSPQVCTLFSARYI